MPTNLTHIHTPSGGSLLASHTDANRSHSSGESRRGRVLALLCLVYFLVILDAAIVRLALPSIDLALGLSPASQTWVANAYMLSFGTLLLLGGRLADLLGRKRILLVGVGVFTLASLACGLASSGAMLIAARALQGLGAAAMTPAALSILMRTFPEGAERNRATGAWGATGGMAATAAWIVGGPLIDGPGWQWVFWINIPVGLAIAALAVGMLGESRDTAAMRGFDVAGVLSVTAALVALVYALVEAPNAGWISAQTVALFALSLALFGTFAAIERRATAPLVPRRIAGSRTLLAANLGLGLTAASIYGMAFIISLYGQEVLGYSALTFGVAAVVLPFGVALGAAIGQALVTRRGPRAVSATGIAGLAVGFVLLARLPVHGSYVTDLLPAFLLFGVPLGLAFTAYSVATLTGVAGRDAGLASGLNNTFEQVGGAVGTALMATIATARTEHLLHAGAGHMFALDRGIQLSFATAIAFPVLGLIVSLLLPRQTRSADAIDPLGAAATPATCAE
jgi:EmrB/QacA subfamily drug resistance transporter